MKMSKLSLIAALAIGSLVAFSANAQPAPGGEAGGKKGAGRGYSVENRLKAIDEAVKLTDAQKPKVKTALEESNKKMTELREDTTTPQQDRRAKMQTIRTETDAAIKKILTPEQVKLYEAMPAPSRGGKAGGKKGGEGAAPDAKK
jgi:periplasmic protein CpxP/Spy